MRRPLSSAVAVVLGALWAAACVGASVASAGAANFLLREGGTRLLAVGAATTLAGTAVVVGAVALAIGRIARRGDWSARLDLAAAALVVAGAAGVRAGVQAINRVAPIDAAATLAGTTAVVAALTPTVALVLLAAYGLFRGRF